MIAVWVSWGSGGYAALVEPKDLAKALENAQDAMQKQAIERMLSGRR